jgi:hypothetical protein
MTTIAEALVSIRPDLADRYANQVRRSFGHIVSVLGPKLTGVYNSWQFAANYKGLVSQYVTTAADGTRSIDEGRLAIGAAKYAEEASIEWQAKIEAKLGSLEDIKVRHYTGATFVIGGLRDGHQVAIEQDIVTKASSKGLLFNQFPARIYVDGKFTSEKKYHALFA